MNPLDDFDFDEELPERTIEEEAAYQRQIREIQRRIARRQRAMRSRQRAESSSSESEMETKAEDASGTTKLTPASGNTPPDNEEKQEKKDELVKLDPAEIGKSFIISMLYQYDADHFTH